MLKSNTDIADTDYTIMVSDELKKINHIDAEMGMVKQTKVDASNIHEKAILKIPDFGVLYWCEKLTSTALGEPFSDMWSESFGFGYGLTFITLFAIFFISIAFQLEVQRYRPALFWLVMTTSSIASTCFSDLIIRTFQMGYVVGMVTSLGLLLIIFRSWQVSGEPMNVTGAMSRGAEAFYWATILVSHTLATALNDFFADSLKLGFGVSAEIFGALLLVLMGLAYCTKVSHAILFWIAFVLTRPFGTAFGDLLTKSKAKGGLELGNGPASAVIFGLFLVFFCIEMLQIYTKKSKSTKKIEVADEK